MIYRPNLRRRTKNRTKRPTAAPVSNRSTIRVKYRDCGDRRGHKQALRRVDFNGEGGDNEGGLADIRGVASGSGRTYTDRMVQV